MSNQLDAVIGIETHVQLKTKTKLFCGCDNDAREAAPNTKICPVCMGFPGALPVLNEQAVKLALKAGLALNAELAVKTKFDRKNYFYPDLPSGYQITQFDQPIIGHGHVDVMADGETVRVGITRAHMEADAGKLTHPDGTNYSLVDYNRSGTPLIEIVSEPDMRSAAQAKAYAQEVHNLMRYAGVSEANLYYGNMRFDINVSVKPKGSEVLGTRSETKNLNSFKAIERAAEYEIKRQIEVLERGDKVVQETRGWDDAKQRTFSQRSKEEAHDYRYFPEPDLPPLVITPAMKAEAKAAMPMMPGEIRELMKSHQLNNQSSAALVNYIEITKLFLSVADIDSTAVKRVANWLIGLPEEAAVNLEERLKLNGSAEALARSLVELSTYTAEGKFSSTNAKVVLDEVITDLSIKVGDTIKIAERLNLIQNSDSGEIERLVDEAIMSNPGSVADYKSGKSQALGFLVGQVMQASRGQANPPMVSELLKQKLGA